MVKGKIDLNAPAFGEGAQKVEELAVEAEAKPAIVETKVDEVVVVPSVEESKVPYSRFKKFHDRALEAEKEADDWRAKAEALENQPTRLQEPVIDPQDEAFKLWLENFGDNEASRKAWVNQLKITSSLEDRALARAEERAREAVRNERHEEAARTTKYIAQLDNQFEDLQAFVGRDLTDKEQSAVLEIVDEYTPKDEDGDYAGALLPFDKAWEIYNLKEQVGKAPKVASRNAVAGLSGNGSEGDTTITAEQNKNWNPLDWNAWQKRL